MPDNNKQSGVSLYCLAATALLRRLDCLVIWYCLVWESERKVLRTRNDKYIHNFTEIIAVRCSLLVPAVPHISSNKLCTKKYTEKGEQPHVERVYSRSRTQFLDQLKSQKALRWEGRRVYWESFLGMQLQNVIWLRRLLEHRIWLSTLSTLCRVFTTNCTFVCKTLRLLASKSARLCQVDS